MRRKLIDQVGGEVGELVLELQLHPRRQKGRAFEQPADHRIDPVFHQPAEPLGHARVGLGEFAGLLAQDREFLVVEPEKFPVHGSEPIDLDLARVDLDLGDELKRRRDGLDAKLGVDEKSDAQLMGADRVVPPGLDGAARHPGFELR